MLRILFHDDFDGIISAALCTAHLQASGWTGISYTAVDYNPATDAAWAKSWPDMAEDQLFAVVDFKYHPSAIWYVDHHRTAFPKPRDHAHFLAQQLDAPERFQWNPEAPSCAQVIYDAYSTLEGWGPVVQAANMIDQAAYPNADYYFHADDIAIRLSMAHRFMSGGQKGEVIRRLVQTKNLAAAAVPVLDHIRDATRREREGLVQTERAITTDGPVAVVDLTSGGLPFVRFAPYFYHPKAKYSATVWPGPSTGDIRVTLSKNPWLAPTELDLSSLVRPHGGGGHPYAAGVLFTGPTAGVQAWNLVRHVVATCSTSGAAAPLDDGVVAG